MTRCASPPPDALQTPEWLPGLADAQTRLLGALTGICGHTGSATVDLAALGRWLGLRDLTWRIALLSLRMAGRIEVAHDRERFETATVTLPERRG